MKRKIVIALVFLLSVFLLHHFSLALPAVYGDQNSDQNYEEILKQKEAEQKELEKKIEEYSQKLNELNKQHRTLAGQIKYYNTQIQLTNYRIKKLEKEKEVVETTIKLLKSKITILNTSLEKMKIILTNRLVQEYKLAHLSSVSFLNGQDFNYKVALQLYLKKLIKSDEEMIKKLSSTQNSFNQEKEIKEKRKKQLETITKSLKRQKIILAQQQAEKKRLLEITKGDEKRYQQLLAEAKAQMAALKAFAARRLKSGSGVWTNVPPGKDGWYYSQRDSRWAYLEIGDHSGENILNVGCLITSVAMVHKRYGVNITPITIASNPNFFFSTTAYMLSPWPTLDGLKEKRISTSEIDSSLNNNRPVIVHLNLGGDGHFVVLKKKNGNDYIMNDPWYGPDLPFSKYYHKYQINKAVVYYR